MVSEHVGPFEGEDIQFCLEQVSVINVVFNEKPAQFSGWVEGWFEVEPGLMRQF